MDLMSRGRRHLTSSTQWRDGGSAARTAWSQMSSDDAPCQGPATGCHGMCPSTHRPPACHRTLARRYSTELGLAALRVDKRVVAVMRLSPARLRFTRSTVGTVRVLDGRTADGHPAAAKIPILRSVHRLGVTSSVEELREGRCSPVDRLVYSCWIEDVRCICRGI